MRQEFITVFNQKKKLFLFFKVLLSEINLFFFFSEIQRLHSFQILGSEEKNSSTVSEKKFNDKTRVG